MDGWIEKMLAVFVDTKFTRVDGSRRARSRQVEAFNGGEAEENWVVLQMSKIVFRDWRTAWHLRESATMFGKTRSIQHG
jgi:hypothetical protein